MNDNKKFYWIKLKTNFFNLDEIDFLLSQENGCKYIVLYQMLCLNTANNNGEMSTKIGEMIIPYDVEKISRDTKHFDVDTVIVALELFKKLGLIYEEQDKVFKISNFSEMVGSETKWAEKKRVYREKQKALETGQSKDNVRQEIEYRDKSIEIRDKNIDNNIVIANANDNVSKSKLEEEFDDIWCNYPRKQGKSNALKSYIKARKNGTSKEEVLLGLENYVNYITIEKIQSQYIKQGSTWFNQECWNDDYETKRKLTTKDIQDKIDFSDF